ncbi:hypothetical protein AtubIFM56815_007431 [Aspergillus tubingensis]|uniref:Uncharacterized protein n=1 Tax=Aspergillus tubingensis TaxID=5068 RepID=A0A9W6AMQ2_ASPTU|nr:hypothetical protein AtubIFM56815_007431 [Aspergillus tubingensis]
MAPTRPTLHPLTTTAPKHLTFPSELRERTFTTCLDLDRPANDDKKDEDNEATITPPSAYTEFLNTFSPIFSSPTTSRANFYKYMAEKPRSPPTSAPSSTTSTTFPSSRPSRSASNSLHQASNALYTSKGPVQRMRLPPPYVYTPSSESPRSGHPLHSPFSPSDWRTRTFESPVSEAGNSFTVRQVVTTTIKYKRAPQLDPPPQGKRRRNLDRRNT